MDSAGREVFGVTDTFYRAFEERHRGSRELIKGRLMSYLGFVEPLLTVYPAAEAVDLGCGRGEWMELLEAAGFKSKGVDFDKGMLEVCYELGLDVELGDAVAYLASQPDQSKVAVSAFHVVEHITFDQLRTLVTEALRVLKPGGLLIMETPNPENIVVATCNFYLDPTHQRPIPSGLLAFIAEHAGFHRVKTLRLQESKELVNKADLNLKDVFSGASPDYAVVAQKYADDEVLAKTSEAFSIEFGLSLDNLLTRWDDRFDRLEAKAQQAEAKAQQAEAKAQQAEAKAQQAAANVTAMLNSTSWRVTAPLRWIASLARSLPRRGPRSHLKAVLQHAALYLGRRPRLKRLALRVLSLFPSLKSRLSQVAMGGAPVPVRPYANVPAELCHLSPRARQIHADLILAMKKNRKEKV